MANDQYSFAWDKLKELVIFEQKKEALGLAKLLGHFMDDRMLALKLQADLFLYFKDISKAKEIYTKIEAFYTQSSKQKQATAINAQLKLL